jgi:uncharacterized protein (DUF2141 family)
VIRFVSGKGAGLLLAAPLLLSATTPPPVFTVQVEVSGLRNAKGVVRACMTPNRAKFPRCQGDTTAFAVVKPAADAAQITFARVPAGHYAIALLHDENNNGKADRALSMIPREGFGFSRDAKVVMGPPSFDDAVFEVTGGPHHQTIRMRYML